MKTIINIARNELRQFFYSPIAWGLLIVFFVIVGTSFSALINTQTSIIATGGSIQGDLTQRIFSSNYGLFIKVIAYIYLLIPLLAMGLISNEKTLGSNKLLLSSPVTHTQVVLGKFGSVMVYGLLLLCSLLIPVIFSAVVINALDIWPILVGMFGLYLLMLAYAAVTIFMSCLTRYQIVAAIGTIAALFLMNYSRRIGQDIPFLRDLAYWLAMSGRQDSFVGGLLASEDLIYFLAIISMFLCLTILTLRSSTTKQSTGRRIMQYSGVVLATFLVGFVSTRPGLMVYYDATRMKSQTLTGNSQEVMKLMDGPLTFTTYVNLLQNDVIYGLPKQFNNDVSRFERYRRFKPEIKMKYVYYYHQSPDFSSNRFELGMPIEERAEKWARAKRTKLSLWKTPGQINQVIDLEGEHYRFVRVIERGDGTSSHLRLYDDMRVHPTETEISAALKRLVVKPPKVGFLVGHGERNIASMADAGYYYFASYVNFRHALINQGFEVDTVSLAAGRGIPADVDILVISDPRSEIPAGELSQIESFIASGGDMVIASKPRRSGFIEPVLEQIGVGLIPGTLAQESSSRTPNIIVGDITRQAAAISRMYRPYAREGLKIVGSEVSGLTWQTGRGFEIYPMVATDSLATDTTRVWNEMETSDFENETPVFNPDAGEKLLTKVPVILGLERTVGDKMQRIVVMGDADFISNAGFMTQRTEIAASNYGAIMGSFSWLTENEFPVDTDRQYGPDREVRYIDFKDRGWISPFFNWVIPGLIGLFGALLLIRRKGK